MSQYIGAGTIIVTKKGPVKIEKLVGEANVFDRNGNYKQVTITESDKPRTMYKYVFRSYSRSHERTIYAPHHQIWALYSSPRNLTNDLSKHPKKSVFVSRYNLNKYIIDMVDKEAFLYGCCMGAGKNSYTKPTNLFRGIEITVPNTIIDYFGYIFKDMGLIQTISGQNTFLWTDVEYNWYDWNLKRHTWEGFSIERKADAFVGYYLCKHSEQYKNAIREPDKDKAKFVRDCNSAAGFRLKYDIFKSNLGPTTVQKYVQRTDVNGNKYYYDGSGRVTISQFDPNTGEENTPILTKQLVYLPHGEGVYEFGFELYDPEVTRKWKIESVAKVGKMKGYIIDGVDSVVTSGGIVLLT